MTLSMGETGEHISQIGDFAVRILDGKLLLPPELWRLKTLRQLRTVEQLAAYIQAFPSDVADELGWHVADVRQAWLRLSQQLEGHISDAYLRPQVPAKRSSGARMPEVRWLENRPGALSGAVRDAVSVLLENTKPYYYRNVAAGALANILRPDYQAIIKDALRTALAEGRLDQAGEELGRNVIRTWERR